MSLLVSALMFVAAQGGNIGLPPPPDQNAIVIRPGQGPAPTPGGASQASEIAEPVALVFAAFDANMDGRTTWAELQAGLERSFAAADTNRDGALGYIEFSGWATTWLGSQTALPGPYQIDANGDDRLSRDEFIEAFRQIFARQDRDGDGAVTHAELLTLRNPPRPPLPQPRQDQRRQQRQR